MFQATRQRLALWYSTVTAILLLLFASGFYFYVRTTLIDRIDDTLSHVVEVVERSVILRSDAFASGQSPFSPTDPVTESLLDDDHIDLEWFSPQGTLLGSTLSGELDIPMQAQRQAHTVYRSTGYGLRQLTEPVLKGDQLLGYLRVSHPWFEVTKPIRQLSIDLSLGLALMIASAGAIGWLLSGLAMQPVWASYQRLKQFTADASHELRSPIASIQTNVQVALADPDLDLQSQQTWTVVERLTRRLGGLVEDLLFLARQDSGMVQSLRQLCPLDELLIEVIEEQNPIAQERDIKLTLEIQPDPIHTLAQPIRWRALRRQDPVKSDPPLADSQLISDPVAPEDAFALWGNYDQLARLFTNLVNNAIQYTDEGGKVTVHLEKLQLQGVATLQVKVIDTGIGIPAAALPHLFDRFYRVDPARTHSPTSEPQPTGSGLGLAITQAIVTNHQGDIQVSSELDQGTTFTVTLPWIQAEPSISS